jgi:hypothetical protein
MGVLASFDYTICNMGIKLPDAKMVSLIEEMERASGVWSRRQVH